MTRQNNSSHDNEDKLLAQNIAALATKPGPIIWWRSPVHIALLLEKILQCPSYRENIIWRNCQLTTNSSKWTPSNLEQPQIALFESNPQGASDRKWCSWGKMAAPSWEAQTFLMTVELSTVQANIRIQYYQYSLLIKSLLFHSIDNTQNPYCAEAKTAPSEINRWRYNEATPAPKSLEHQPMLRAEKSDCTLQSESATHPWDQVFEENMYWMKSCWYAFGTFVLSPATVKSQTLAKKDATTKLTGQHTGKQNRTNHHW